tara:strand:- start:7 stop:288 length:282 start_codon:yes stop_codon:yes gene_type:complete
MYKELSILFGILSVCLFMTLHNNNLEVIEEQTYQSKKQKLSQENFLMSEGTLIKLSNGVTLKRDADLIIVEQSSKTIILNIKDSEEIIAFLED